MTQRVIRTGNSLAVTVPKKFARDLGIKKGDQVRVEKRPDRATLLLHFKGIQQLIISNSVFRSAKNS